MQAVEFKNAQTLFLREAHPVESGRDVAVLVGTERESLFTIVFRERFSGLLFDSGAEATLHVHGDGFSLDASAYYTKFSNYISENQVDQVVCEAAAAPSGREVELPCFQYQQQDARYYGFEADASLRVATLGAYTINADVLGDYVRANIIDQGAIPRIPAARVLGGIEAQGDTLQGRVEVEHVFEQNRIAAFETPTDDYTMVNASIGFSPFGKGSKTSFLISANNIFDVEARRSASFLKDFAPLAGRDIRATLRFGL